MWRNTLQNRTNAIALWQRYKAITLALLVAALCIFGALSSPAQAPLGPVARGRGGAVAAVDSRATQVGLNVLQQGGNAVDAAIATAAALGVLEPFSCGIGGGGFFVLRQADGTVVTLDGREEAPASASPKMFRDPDNPEENLPFFPNRISNGAAVGVPGTPLLWHEALSRYGTFSLAEALQPAIALAESGFGVDDTFAAQVALNQGRFAAFISTRDLYLPNGAPPAVGGTFRNPDLARTYRQIAQDGVNAVYRGDIGRAIVQTVQQPPVVDAPPFPIIPGGMTLADLDRYHVVARPPVTTTYRDHQFYGMGLPSSGGITTFQVLNLLEGVNLATLDRAQAWHQVIEAERLAYGDRAAYLGDPEYVDAPVAGLLDPSYAEVRRDLIKDTAAPAPAARGNPYPFQQDPSPSVMLEPVAAGPDGEGLSTTHLTAADAAGNVVSYTLTIESTGGSGMVVPGYGFLLNNELTDFDAVTPHPNAPEPGKRPRSSMAPTIAVAPDGTVMAFGSPGGSTIITTVLGIAVNAIDFGLPLDEAIAAPRLSQRNGETTQVDGGFEQTDTGQGLTALGHRLGPVAEIGAATGVVVFPDGDMAAAAEPQRRGGGGAGVLVPQ
ncbi:MAG: gamma-glutamyltransferase [Elainellaceae cyanobacterium]